MPEERDETRARIIDATLACALESGFNFSLEQVARVAGCSRATIYRYFDGGKDELISQAISWEAGRFFTAIEREVRDEVGLEAKIERALAAGRARLAQHEVLQKILSEEPDRLLPELELTMVVVVGAIRTYLETLLADETLAAGVDEAEAADYLTRMFLTYLGTQGSWDLSDPDQLGRLVRTQFVAGILA